MHIIDRISADVGVLDEGGCTPGGDGWSCWDGMAVGIEDAWVLYGLVRAIRPCLVVSCSGGWSAVVLAAALSDCDPIPERPKPTRTLVVSESDPQWADVTEERLERYGPFAPNVEITLVGEPTTELASGRPPDLVFVDSGPPELRAREIERWTQPGVAKYVAIHDARLGGRGAELPEHVRPVQDIVIDSARGIRIIRP